jgi:hypothetical protein
VPPHVLFVDFVILSPGHGRSVTYFWGWDAHEAQLRCPDGVWVVIEGDVGSGGALNLNSTNLPRPRSPRETFSSRKIPTVEPGIEPGTEWLVVSDYEAGRWVGNKLERMCKKDRATCTALRKDVTVIIVRVMQSALLEMASGEGLPEALIVRERQK